MTRHVRRMEPGLPRRFSAPLATRSYRDDYAPDRPPPSYIQRMLRRGDAEMFARMRAAICAWDEDAAALYRMYGDALGQAANASETAVPMICELVAGVPRHHHEPLWRGIASRCKAPMFEAPCVATGPVTLLEYYRSLVGIRDPRLVIDAARTVFADERRRDAYGAIEGACIAAVDILGDLPEGAAPGLLDELEALLGPDEDTLRGWFDDARERRQTPRPTSAPLEPEPLLLDPPSWESMMFDTETDQFPNDHDRYLSRLAALVDDLAAHDPIFDEIPPAPRAEDADDDEPTEPIDGDERLENAYKLHAYLPFGAYEVVSPQTSDWLDVEAMLALLEAICADGKIDARFVSLATDDQTAWIAAGPAATIARAIEEGELVTESPDAAARRGADFEANVLAEIDRRRRIELGEP